MKIYFSIGWFFSSLCLIFLLLPLTDLAQTITTIAGKGIAGYSGDGGKGTEATLNIPSGLAFDSDSNLLIADLENHVIRELNLKTGVISTIAGVGSLSFTGDGGPAIKAGLSGPTGIHVDKAGNIYFTEQYSNTIRKINKLTGIITTIAGTAYVSSYSGDGGLATNALLNRPTNIDMDQDGNIYFADWQNNVIRKINGATGIISTVAGKYPGSQGFSGDGGPASDALLRLPPSICVDASGDLLIADQANYVIRKVNAGDGAINTVVGTTDGGYAGDGGPAIIAKLNLPAGITLDRAGNMIIADAYNHVIRCVNVTNGNISTIAGNGEEDYSGDGGPALQASFRRPVDVITDRSGNLYIADARNHNIRKVNLCTPVLLGNDISLCSSGTVDLFAGNDFVQYQWNTGETTPELKVDEPGEYQVEVTNIHLCVTHDTILVKEPAETFLNWKKDSIICEAVDIFLPDGARDIEWQDGSSSTKISVRNTGTYWVNFSDTNNCFVTDTLVFNRTVPRPADFLADEAIYCGVDNITLITTQAFETYQWSTGSQMQSIIVYDTGNYRLTVKDENNCIWEDSITVISCFRSVQFPNAFSPNNDGRNDEFKPLAWHNPEYYQMNIYNRWGQKIFESKDPRKGWNGYMKNNPQPPGSYVWQIIYQLPGESRKTEKGVVTLVR